MGQHVHELLHVAAATLFIVAALSALLEYRVLRERVVLTYAVYCSCAAGYAAHVAISHSLPKLGAFWIPWTSVALSATFFYLLTMQRFVGVRGRWFSAALVVQLAITMAAVGDVLLYAVVRRSFMFLPIPRQGLGESQRTMISRGVQLEVVAEPAIGGVMIAPGQLTQVLMNLVINARDAMADRGTIRIYATTLSPRTHLSDARAQPKIVISVIDEGSGMPAEVLEHVFEPFFTTKADVGGSGLGLATLYSIVRKAGGHVEVGRGTRFDVVLPRFQS